MRRYKNKPCDYRTTLYTLVKRVVARCGFNLSEISIGLGYENPTTLHSILARTDQKGANPSRYRPLLALREVGATPEELIAIFTAYIEETGDASLLLDIDEHIRKRAARRIAEELDCSGLFQPPKPNERLINVKHIQSRRIAIKKRRQENLQKMLAARDIQLSKTQEEEPDAA